MKKLILFMFLLLSFTTFASDEGCIAITNEKLCIQLEWEQGPYIGIYSKNIVKFKDLKTSSVNKTLYTSPSGSIQFFGWMDMGGHEHGTRPVTTKREANGIYVNTKIFYMDGMKGTWMFKVKIAGEEFILHSLSV